MTPQLIRAAKELELVSCWMTPFLRVVTGIPKKRILEAFLAPFAGTIPVTVQLAATDPSAAASAAAALAALGVQAFNLNFGCPSRQMRSSGAGGGALRDPAGMMRMVEAVKAAVPACPLSIKIRSGWSDPAEQEIFLPMLASCGCVDRFFIHFRTVMEQYRPVAGRIERFRRSLELAGNVPVVLNGDVDTPKDAEQLAAELPGASGIMCARGWLRDPYLLRRLEGRSAPELEIGRKRFFRTVVGNGFPVHQSIELSNFIWGRERNPYFRQLITLSPHAEFCLGKEG